MSNFSGNNVFVMLFSICLLLLLNIVVGSPPSASGVEDYQNLFGLSSREEVVEIAGYGEEKLSTVLITGSLHCDGPNHHHSQSHAWPIPGALVSVNCQSHATERKGKSMVANGVTDEFGDFMVDLPSYLHAIPNLEKICRVKVHKIPKGSLCRPARRVNKQKGLFKLSTIGNGIRTYDAGTIRIQHSASETVRASPRKYIGEIKE